MLIPGQIIIKKWSKRNKEWYENKGYVFTGFGDTIQIKAEDLSKGAKDKVKVKCDYCGEIIEVVWKDYYTCMNYKKYACKKCRLQKASESTLQNRRNDLYNRAMNICRNHDYILLTPKENINGADSIIQYQCPTHGIRTTKIYTLITGHICRQCTIETNSEKSKLNIEYMTDYFNTHGCQWINPCDYISSTTKNLQVTCPECGNIFLTSFFAFKKHNGQRCPTCTKTESSGESKVRCYLENNKISFISQYRFHDCRTKVPLPFDFYLPDYNILIEYDGIGHYEPVRRGSMTVDESIKEFKNIQARDSIKTNYCINNNIQLIRIPYWEYDNIENLLKIQLDLHEDIV